MIHLHIVRRVPPPRVEELLDRIWQMATDHGTFNITNLIDEYREDVFLVRINDKKEQPSGRNSKHQDHLHDAEARGEARVRRT